MQSGGGSKSDGTLPLCVSSQFWLKGLGFRVHCRLVTPYGLYNGLPAIRTPHLTPADHSGPETCLVNVRSTHLLTS